MRMLGGCWRARFATRGALSPCPPPGWRWLRRQAPTPAGFASSTSAGPRCCSKTRAARVEFAGTLAIRRHTVGQ